jgi:hypothetical protein
MTMQYVLTLLGVSMIVGSIAFTIGYAIGVWAGRTQ